MLSFVRSISIKLNNKHGRLIITLKVLKRIKKKLRKKTRMKIKKIIDLFM
jgi:hypothetical protein